MKWIPAALLCVAAALSSAQTSPDPQNAGSGLASSPQNANTMPPPQADTAASQRSAGATIPATLAKSVDSKKAKSGDSIEATTAVSLSSPSGEKIPAGSKIIGHITDAKAKAKGDPQSILAFSFEKIVLKTGKEIPLHAVTQAIGPEQRIASANTPASSEPALVAPMGAARGVSGATPAAPGTAGSTRNRPDNPPPEPENQSSNSAQLPPNAIGVVGVKGLTLNSQADAAVISSDSKSVKLNEGTQLLLRPVSQ